jgi:hypothetical protein
LNAKELAKHIFSVYEDRELPDIVEELLSERDERIKQLEHAVNAFDDILWMAEKYAEGGGMYSIEMEDYQRVKEIIDSVKGKQ